MYQRQQMKKKTETAKSIRNGIFIMVVMVVVTYSYFSFHMLTKIRDNDVVDDTKSLSKDALKLSALSENDNDRQQQFQRVLQETDPTNTDEATSSSQPKKATKKGTDPTQFLTLKGVDAYYSKHLSQLNTVVTNWPPENPDGRPSDWVDVVPTFDWTDADSRKAAQMVREAEYPFKIINQPELAQVKKKWNYEYLAKRFGSKKGNVEVSESNSFMYWKKTGNSRSGPTAYERMSWKSFLSEAKELDESNSPNKKHFYWHTSGNSDRWITEDLEYFKKTKDNFFIVDPSEYTVPIACRVGTKGLCNENHYDTHRTFASQIFGSKRWIFQPPSDCSNMYLYPERHMSARHSAVDINSGNINFTKWPLAAQATAIETVVEAGEIAYLPSNWFHHIISLEFNMQCIARSGHSLVGDDYIEECGFAGGQRAMGGKRAKKKRG